MRCTSRLVKYTACHKKETHVIFINSICRLNTVYNKFQCKLQFKLVERQLEMQEWGSVPILAEFNHRSSIFMVQYRFKVFVTFFILSVSELSMVGLPLDMVD